MEDGNGDATKNWYCGVLGSYDGLDDSLLEEIALERYCVARKKR